MKVEMISGLDQIRGVITSIGTRAAAYKAVISSAVLSSYNHYRVHGDYTLLQEAMDTVFETNYRDYAAVMDFIKAYTAIGLTMENRGRRQHYTIVGTLSEAMGARPANVSQKDWADKIKSTKENETKRNTLFDDFAHGREVPMRNPDWTLGMDKELRKVGVIYEGDIFKWHDDFKWLRNIGSADTANAGAGGEQTMSPEQVTKVTYQFEERIMKTANKPIVAVINHMLERFEADSQIYATPEEIELLERRAKVFITRIKARSEAKAQIDADKAQAAGVNQQAAEVQPEAAEAGNSEE